MITITKTREQAKAEAEQRLRIAQEHLKDCICPYCNDDVNIEIVHSYASAMNPLIHAMVELKVMKDKVRREYHCYKCGAEWHGKWYDCK